MATRYGSIALALIAIVGFLHSRSFAGDDYNDKATSTNGRWKVEISLANRPGIVALGFVVAQKEDKEEFREKGRGVIDDLSFRDRFEKGILCRTLISDEGRFAVIGIVNDERKTVMSLHASDGKRVAALTLTQLLTQQEIEGLSVFSKHFPYLHWHKKDSLKIEGEFLHFETPAGRKVTIALGDGKVTQNPKSDKK